MAPERTNERDPYKPYQQSLKTLYARYGASMDISKADYMIGVDMAKRRFSPNQIGKAIEQAREAERNSRDDGLGR